VHRPISLPELSTASAHFEIRDTGPLTGIQQFGDFLLREVLQATLWGYPRIDHV